MIEWISDWAGSIIVAVIIGTIIEMILPSGNSKKYIKMVIGVYILFTIVSPVITKFTGGSLQVSDTLDLDEYIEEAKNSVKLHNTLVEDNEQSIRDMYISGIKDDMKAKLEAKGYVANNIELNVSNDETYTINNINLELEKINDDENTKEDNNANNTKEDNISKVEKVEKVSISYNSENINNTSTQDKEDSKTSDKETNLSNKEIKSLKEYLSSVYEVKEDNITIN